MGEFTKTIPYSLYSESLIDFSTVTPCHRLNVLDKDCKEGMGEYYGKHLDRTHHHLTTELFDVDEELLKPADAA